MPARRALMLVPLVLVAAWCAWRFAELPERFATSFDFAGNPRDTTSRGAYVGLVLGMLGAMALVFGGLATWLPSVPKAWINVPEKDHWLAPERVAATMARLSLFLDVVGLATCAMLATLFVAIGENAIAGRREFPTAWLAAPGVLVVLVAVAIAWLDAPFRARRRALRATR